MGKWDLAMGRLEWGCPGSSSRQKNLAVIEGGKHRRLPLISSGLVKKSRADFILLGHGRVAISVRSSWRTRVRGVGSTRTHLIWHPFVQGSIRSRAERWASVSVSTLVCPLLIVNMSGVSLSSSIGSASSQAFTIFGSNCVTDANATSIT